MAKPVDADRPVIVWFRRDLRLGDHPALLAAVQSGRPVIPLFILEDDPPVRAPGAAALWWLDKSLAALGEALEGLGSRLVLRRGDAGEGLRAVVQETHAAQAVWSRSYEPQMDARDTELAERLRADGVEAGGCEGKLLFDPDTVRTKTGNGPYGVFTPFWRAAVAQMPDWTLHGAPHALKPPKPWPKSEALTSWGLHPSAPDWSKGFDWRPGEAGAHARLEALLDDKLKTYPHDRDRPALDGSSRLSPHLAWGEISPRQVHRAATARMAAHGLEEQGAKFLTELGWREFDYNLLAQDPALADKPFKAALDTLKWRRSEKDLEAWKRGRTGYPIVDAGMRQLWTLGWMHNRVRLITSSFLVKHLLIDWREGERWFWDCLVDADPANNPANWQWSAGVGADAQPFFRIFNPMTQGAKFDPDGDYVRAWAPELVRADAKWIHQPWTASDQALKAAGVALGDSYPRPIVEHETARKRALDALNAARRAG